MARPCGQRNADQFGLHFVKRGGFGIHRDVAAFMGEGDPALEGGGVADAFVFRGVDGGQIGGVGGGLVAP